MDAAQEEPKIQERPFHDEDSVSENEDAEPDETMPCPILMEILLEPW